MFRIHRLVAIALSSLILLVTFPGAPDAQRRAVPRHPAHPDRQVVVRGQVFIGGYFYDPFFGRYPWWRRGAYPYWYFPVFDNRAELRLSVQPDEAETAAVYVDGFYAGIVDDFNGVFQGLPLTPGGHRIVLYLEGFRTVTHHIYLRPGSTFKLRQTMDRLPAGVASERPELSPPVPAPPAGTYTNPVTPPTLPPSAIPTRPEAAGFGTLDLYVQPETAEVKIDGERWTSSDEGHFVVQVPAGRHRVEIRKTGYRQFTTEIEVGDGATRPLNVSLMEGSR